MAAPRLIELGDTRVAAALDSALAEIRPAVVEMAARQRVATLGVLTLLSVSGIAAVPLKGVLMTERLYGDPAARWSSDIDVLVSPETLPRAVELACGLGYEKPTDPVDADGLPLLHFELPGDPTLELHWRVHWFERDFAARALARAQNGQLQAGDELVMLLLFYARDGFTGLRQAADLAAWWDRYGSAEALERVREVGEEAPRLRSVLVAASAVAARTVALPDPWAGRGASRLAARLANWRLEGSQDRWRADASLVDVTLAPHGTRLRTLRRHALVSVTEMDGWRRPVAHGQLGRRVEQITRPLKLGVRWLGALSRVARATARSQLR